MAKRDRKDEAGRVASGKYSKGCENYSSCQYPPHSPIAPQELNPELLVKVPVVELREHSLVPPSHLIHSRPREAEAGGLRTQGLEIAGKTNPSKTKCLAQGVVRSNRPLRIAREA